MLRPHGSMEISSCLFPHPSEHVLITMTVYCGSLLACWDLLGFYFGTSLFHLVLDRQQIKWSHWQSNNVKILAWLRFWKAGMFDNVQIIMGKHLDTVEHACSQCCFLICFRFVLLCHEKIGQYYTSIQPNSLCPEWSPNQHFHVASNIAPIWGTLLEEIRESKWRNRLRMAILLGWPRWQTECWLVVCWWDWQWEGFNLSGLLVVKMH